MSIRCAPPAKRGDTSSSPAPRRLPCDPMTVLTAELSIDWTMLSWLYTCRETDGHARANINKCHIRVEKRQGVPKVQTTPREGLIMHHAPKNARMSTCMCCMACSTRTAVVKTIMAHLDTEAGVLSGSNVALHHLHRKPLPRPGSAQGSKGIRLRLLS